MSNKEKRVLKYMQDFGSITSIEAFAELGETRLSATIFNLKKYGFNIVSKRETNTNRYGESVHYSRYSLSQDDKQGHKDGNLNNERAMINEV